MTTASSAPSPFTGIVRPKRCPSIYRLDILFGDWMQPLRTKDENYYDAHCSVFTPSSFEL